MLEVWNGNDTDRLPFFTFLVKKCKGKFSESAAIGSVRNVDLFKMMCEMHPEYSRTRLLHKATCEPFVDMRTIDLLYEWEVRPYPDIRIVSGFDVQYRVINALGKRKIQNWNLGIFKHNTLKPAKKY
jgi:hypothetical protein